MKEPKEFVHALQAPGSFSGRLVKAFLGRTEIRQYVERVFGPVFNKVMLYRSSPRNVLSRFRPSGATQPDGDLTNTTFLDPVLPLSEDETKLLETMSLSELFDFCDQIMESIASQLDCMPTSVRCLLKIVFREAQRCVSFCHLITML